MTLLKKLALLITQQVQDHFHFSGDFVLFVQQAVFRIDELGVSCVF